MSDEFLLSLRHSLHHLYDVARTLSWLHFLPLTILSVVIFLLPGCGDNQGNTTDPVRTVRYVVVGSAQTLPALERTGEIHAHDETILSFRTGGRIVTRSVDIGDRVNAGQLLATLENTTSPNAKAYANRRDCPHAARYRPRRLACRPRAFKKQRVRVA